MASGLPLEQSIVELLRHKHMVWVMDRTAPDVRALRNAIGHERFRACVDQGARMSYEELITWLLATLDAMNSAPPADPTTERQSAETGTG